MIREIRDRKITRDDVYAKYFSLCDVKDRNITEDFAKDIQEAEEIFKGKTKINIFIRGKVFTQSVGQSEGMRYFTFVDEEYSIDKENLEKVLMTIDRFSIFMNAITPEEAIIVTEPIIVTGEGKDIFFSKIENEFVSRKIVASASIMINVE